MKIIVIDDASTDETIEICKSFQIRFPGVIEVIELKENEHSQGILVGLSIYKSIKTKYIAWCDGDDYWIDKSKIRSQVEYLERNPTIGIVHSDYLYLEEKIDKSKLRERNVSEIKKAIKSINGRDLVFGNCIKNSTAMILTSSINLRFASAPFGITARDWLMYISSAQYLRIHFQETKTAVVRITESGIWNKGSVERNYENKNLLRWYCAASLDESELRNEFRRFLIREEIRKMLSSSHIYKIIRPIFMISRRIKSKFIEVIK